MASNKSKKIVHENDVTLKSHGSLILLLLYGAILVLYFFALAAHRFKDTGRVSQGKNGSLSVMKNFKNYFFTGWTFGLQIIFLILAVTDEASKIVNLPIQRRIEKIRLFLFSTLVFPSSLLVTSVFWSIWHIDRELIFPRAIDSFYPSWLNHTLHTFIIIPLIVEVLVQSKNKNYRISRRRAAFILAVYCAIYQTLYLSVYFQHGIWLYPVYKVLNWTQRIGFILLQFFLVLSYQQIGISLLKSEKTSKTKTT